VGATLPGVDIASPRLELVPATVALLDAELESASTLASLLDAQVPEGWPPGEYDRPAIEFFRARLAESPDAAGWYGWYALLRGAGGQARTVVGAGGFFGPPDADGLVEIGCSIVPAFEKRGLATELVRALVSRAFETGRVRTIIAHTRPDNAGSVKVLERCGFTLADPGREPDPPAPSKALWTLTAPPARSPT
jgi:ribosomal-protein-alanine N-acetyltransferase